MKNRIADELAKAGSSWEQSARDDEKSNNVADMAMRQLNAVRQSAEQFVGSHPAICLGAALVTGIAVGWWVKRK